MNIRPELACVYHGGHRRWLSLKSACRAEAKKLIKARCDCSSYPESEGGDFLCKYHSMPTEKWKEIVERLMMRFMDQYKKDEK